MSRVFITPARAQEIADAIRIHSRVPLDDEYRLFNQFYMCCAPQQLVPLLQIDPTLFYGHLNYRHLIGYIGQYTTDKVVFDNIWEEMGSGYRTGGHSFDPMYPQCNTLYPLQKVREWARVGEFRAFTDQEFELYIDKIVPSHAWRNIKISLRTLLKHYGWDAQYVCQYLNNYYKITLWHNIPIESYIVLYGMGAPTDTRLTDTVIQILRCKRIWLRKRAHRRYYLVIQHLSQYVPTVVNRIVSAYSLY